MADCYSKRIHTRREILDLNENQTTAAFMRLLVKDVARILTHSLSLSTALWISTCTNHSRNSYGTHSFKSLWEKRVCVCARLKNVWCATFHFIYLFLLIGSRLHGALEAQDESCCFWNHSEPTSCAFFIELFSLALFFSSFFSKINCN